MSDRTPAPDLAQLDAALVTIRDVCGGKPTDMARYRESVDTLLAAVAAGFRMTPIPDDNTRALAARLRNQLLKYDTLAGGPPRKGFIVLDDVRAAARLLGGGE